MAKRTEASVRRIIGTVKWFSPDKGYGFIEPNAGGPDMFVHHSQINAVGFRRLEEGDQVGFTIGVGPKGKSEAQNVEKLGNDASSRKKDHARSDDPIDGPKDDDRSHHPGREFEDCDDDLPF